MKPKRKTKPKRLRILSSLLQRVTEQDVETLRAKLEVYARVLHRNWVSVGGTASCPGGVFHHSDLPGLTADDRQCWIHYVWKLKEQLKVAQDAIREALRGGVILPALRAVPLPEITDSASDGFVLPVNARPPADPVSHPQHYTFGTIEVIDVIEDWKLGFHLGNAVKYIARADHKGRREEDLRKAVWYLQRALGESRKNQNAER